MYIFLILRKSCDDSLYLILVLEINSEWSHVAVLANTCPMFTPLPLFPPTLRS